MTETEEEQIRSVVRSEILAIIGDVQKSLAMKKDPTGMGRKALEGLAKMIRNRETGDESEVD